MDFFSYLFNWYSSMVWSSYRGQEAPWAEEDEIYANTFWRR